MAEQHYNKIATKQGPTPVREILASRPILEGSKFARKELWLKIGQSNAVGVDTATPFDHDVLDAPNPRLYEISQGVTVNQGGYYAPAPSGELHVFQLPAQDSAAVGLGHWFGRHRLALNPGIEQLVISNRALSGTGFSDNRWNPGDDLFEAAVLECNTFLENNPDFVFMGFLWHQGELDAGNGRTRAEYTLDLFNMLDDPTPASLGMRTRIHGAERAPCIIGTLLQAAIDGAAPGQTGADIDSAHRNIQGTVSRIATVDLSDLIESPDGLHFGAEDVRAMGIRYANAAQEIVDRSYERSKAHFRLQAVGGEFVDVWGSGYKLCSANLIDDPVMGPVLTTDPVSYDTGLNISDYAYTKAAWVKFDALPNILASQFGCILGGDDQAASGILGPNTHGMYYAGAMHGGAIQLASITSVFAGGNQFPAAFDTQQWVHVAVTWDRIALRAYLNGVEIGVAATATDQPTARGLLRIGAFVDDLENINFKAYCRIHDLIVVPWRVSDAVIAEWGTTRPEVTTPWSVGPDLTIDAVTTAPTIGSNATQSLLTRKDKKSLIINWTLDIPDTVGAANGSGNYILDISALDELIDTTKTGTTTAAVSGHATFTAHRLGRVIVNQGSGTDGGEGYLVAINQTQLQVVLSLSGTFAPWSSSNFGVTSIPGIAIIAEIPIL